MNNAKEVEFIQNYMAIMGARFGKRVKIRIRVEPGLEQMRIPKLIIQPLVENGILHGLEPKKEGGTVSVTIEKHGDNLQITVEDDGVGVDKEKALRNTFALKNIDDRIRLRYGREYGLCFESEPGKGTRAVVMLPFEEEQDEPDDRRR